MSNMFINPSTLDNYKTTLLQEKTWSWQQIPYGGTPITLTESYPILLLKLKNKGRLLAYNFTDNTITFSLSAFHENNIMIYESFSGGNKGYEIGQFEIYKMVYFYNDNWHPTGPNTGVVRNYQWIASNTVVNIGEVNQSLVVNIPRMDFSLNVETGLELKVYGIKF